MELVLKLVFSPWFWADIILSVTGGLIVFWGLVIEKRAEKYSPPADFKPDIFADIADAQKAELERGWRILMLGIVFEVVAALGISVISSLEIADLTDKAEQAGKDAADTKLQVGVITQTNLQLETRVEGLRFRNLELEASVLELKMQMQETTTNLAIVGKTANETRDLLGDSNTTAVLKEAKENLAAANKVVTDVRSIINNSNLAKVAPE